MQVERKGESRGEEEEFCRNNGVGFEIAAYGFVSEKKYRVDNHSLTGFERIGFGIHKEFGFTLRANQTADICTVPYFLGLRNL